MVLNAQEQLDRELMLRVVGPEHSPQVQHLRERTHDDGTVTLDVHAVRPAHGSELRVYKMCLAQASVIEEQLQQVQREANAREAAQQELYDLRKGRRPGHLQSVANANDLDGRHVPPGYPGCGCGSGHQDIRDWHEHTCGKCGAVTRERMAEQVSGAQRGASGTTPKASGSTGPSSSA